MLVTRDASPSSQPPPEVLLTLTDVSRRLKLDLSPTALSRLLPSLKRCVSARLRWASWEGNLNLTHAEVNIVYWGSRTKGNTEEGEER